MLVVTVAIVVVSGGAPLCGVTMQVTSDPNWMEVAEYLFPTHLLRVEERQAAILWDRRHNRESGTAVSLATEGRHRHVHRS